MTHDPSRRDFLKTSSAVLAGAVLAPSLVEAQSVGYKRRSANGRDFPSWERDEDPQTVNPLPRARQGRHLLDQDGLA